MAKDSKDTKKPDDKPAAAGQDVQGDDEDPFAYAARRKTELSGNSEHSTYSPGPVPNLVIEERGPIGG